MPIVLEIKFYIVWAIHPVWANPSLSGRFLITLIQYRDTLLCYKKSWTKLAWANNLVPRNLWPRLCGQELGQERFFCESPSMHKCRLASRNRSELNSEIDELLQSLNWWVRHRPWYLKRKCQICRNFEALMPLNLNQVAKLRINYFSRTISFSIKISSHFSILQGHSFMTSRPKNI